VVPDERGEGKKVFWAKGEEGSDIPSGVKISKGLFMQKKGHKKYLQEEITFSWGSEFSKKRNKKKNNPEGPTQGRAYNFEAQTHGFYLYRGLISSKGNTITTDFGRSKAEKTGGFSPQGGVEMQGEEKNIQDLLLTRKEKKKKPRGESSSEWSLEGAV